MTLSDAKDFIRAENNLEWSKPALQLERFNALYIHMYVQLYIHMHNNVCIY